MATALRALVIEDSENDCMLLLSILRRGGYACARTTSVLTTAVVFVWSLMRCLTIRCDRRTPTQNARKTRSERRKHTNHTQVVFVRSVSGRGN